MNEFGIPYTVYSIYLYSWKVLMNLSGLFTFTMNKTLDIIIKMLEYLTWFKEDEKCPTS